MKKTQRPNPSTSELVLQSQMMASNAHLAVMPQQFPPVAVMAPQYLMSGIYQSNMPYASTLPNNFHANGQFPPVAGTTINITAPININNNTFHQNGPIQNNLQTNPGPWSVGSRDAEPATNGDPPSIEYLGDSDLPQTPDLPQPPSSNNVEADNAASVEGGGGLKEEEQNDHAPTPRDSTTPPGKTEDSASIDGVGREQRGENQDDLLSALPTANHEAANDSAEGEEGEGWKCGRCKCINPALFLQCLACDKTKNPNETADIIDVTGSDGDEIEWTASTELHPGSENEGDASTDEAAHETASIIDVTGPDEDEMEGSASTGYIAGSEREGEAARVRGPNAIEARASSIYGSTNRFRANASRRDYGSARSSYSDRYGANAGYGSTRRDRYGANGSGRNYVSFRDMYGATNRRGWNYRSAELFARSVRSTERTNRNGRANARYSPPTYTERTNRNGRASARYSPPTYFSRADRSRNPDNYGRPAYPSENCVICHVKLTEGEQKVLDCGHMFHKECINQWIMHKEDPNCPLCSEELVENDD